MRQQGKVADTDFRWQSSPMSESSFFYRMIVPSIIEDKKLKIPGKFAKKLGNELPAVATLMTPNGCTWKVGLKKIEDKFWFTNGWHGFVEQQSIRVGFLLLFTYEGNSYFRVNVYDLATAEVKYRSSNLSSSEGPHGGIRYPIPYKVSEEEGLIDILDSRKVFDETVDQQKFGQHQSQVPYTQYAGFNFSTTELKNSEHKANGGNLYVDLVGSATRSTQDKGIQCSAYEVRLQSLNKKPEMTKKRKRGTRTDEVESSAKHGGEPQTPGTETTQTSGGTGLRRCRVITPEEKERVLSASKTFQSANPFCRVILRRSYVYKGIGLHMPSTFAEKYLGGVSGFITLQVSKAEKWPVKCMWRDGSAKLSKGWPEFVRDNRLEEGDACIFELIKIDEIVLKVTFIRVEEDAEQGNQFLQEQLGQTSQMGIHYDLGGKLSF